MPTDIEAIADPRDLEGATFDELAEVFESGTAPQGAELDGLYHGRIIALAGSDRLPELARGLLATVYRSGLVPWIGKRFGISDTGGRSGVNTWLTNAGPDFAGFECTPDGDSLLLNYDVKSNLAPLRRIRGELRRLAPALYLGRASVSLGGNSVTVIYFTLDHS